MGLTGDPGITWSNQAGNEFWPLWLRSDIEEVSVYTFGYPASFFRKMEKKRNGYVRAGWERARTVRRQRHR